MNELPILRGLLICEKLIVEQGSGNVSLINCHATRFADRFPSAPQSFVLYGSLIDGFGTCVFDLQVTLLDSDQEMFARSLPMLFVDRLKPVHFIYRLNDLIFPMAGRYQITVWADHQVIDMTSLLLKLKE